MDKSTRDRDGGECHTADTEVLTDQGWKFFSDLNGTERVATRSKDGEFEYQLPLEYFEYDYDGDIYFYETKYYNFAVTPNHRMLLRNLDGSEKFAEIRELNAAKKSYSLVKRAKVADRSGGLIGFPTSIDQIDKNLITGPFSPAEDEYILNHYATTNTLTMCRESGRSVTQLRRRARRLGVKRQRFDRVKAAKENVLQEIPREKFAKFLGFWLAEGTKITSDNQVLVEVSQVKDIGIGWADKMFMDLEWSYRRKEKGDEVEWALFNRELAQYLVSLQQGGLHFPEEALTTWSIAEKEALLEGLCVGDGGLTTGCGWESPCGIKFHAFYSSSLRLINQVQALAAQLGVAGKAKIIAYTGEPTGNGAVSNFDMWSLSFRTTETQTYNTQNVRVSPYKGKVYCLAVPNETLLTRRNGCVLWSGNSISGYLENLRLRAKEFGIMRNEQAVRAINILMEAKGYITLYRNSNDAERREFNSSPEEILAWFETKFDEFEEIDAALRENQKYWIHDIAKV
jgi:hypothetical protein